MSYSKEEILKKCFEIIKEEEPIFIEELIAYLPISKSGFYKMGMHEVDELRDAIDEVKIKAKASLRKSWQIDDNPTLQLAVYRLMSTDEEHKKMSTSYTPEVKDTKKSKFQVRRKK